MRRCTFRPVRPADAPMIRGWLAAPHVRRAIGACERAGFIAVRDQTLATYRVSLMRHGADPGVL